MKGGMCGGNIATDGTLLRLHTQLPRRKLDAGVQGNKIIFRCRVLPVAA
jgi:hypothetical protein